MNTVLEVIDKSGRNIKLTKERWTHVRKDHPEVGLDEIEKTLKTSTNLIQISEEKYYYFHYFKHKNLSKKFLRVIVKYKNGEWFVMTAHFVANVDK